MKVYSSIVLAVIFVIMVSVPAVAGKKETKTEVTTTLTLKGFIQDQLTREKLAGVSIQIGNNEEKIYSEPDGSFALANLEPGITTIKVKCISYKDKEITLDIKSGKKKKFNVLLEPVLP